MDVLIQHITLVILQCLKWNEKRAVTKYSIRDARKEENDGAGSPYRSGLAHFNHLLYGGIGCHFRFGLGAVWLYDNPMAGCVSHWPQNGGDSDTPLGLFSFKPF